MQQSGYISFYSILSRLIVVLLGAESGGRSNLVLPQEWAAEIFTILLLPRLPRRQMNRLASLFMSMPNILISVNYPDPPPSASHRENVDGSIICPCTEEGTFNIWISFFSRISSAERFHYSRLWSARLCFADAAKPNALSHNSGQKKGSEVWFISGD